MPNKPWVNIYNHVYEDSIVGNAAGLAKLKQAIDKALAEGNFVFEDDLETDFMSIRSTEEELLEEEQSYSSRLIGVIIMSVLFIWLVALPVFGIYQLWLSL